ncbi:MAG: bifunctional phosphopantothenoylcysteine decarboxylase/phosphopantothenate--cysteine ligase CoaBC [Thermotogota bacterium]
MAERTVVLGVTGSIAAYKAVDLASRLTQSGVAVHTVMTKSATQLVGPATFRAITGRPVSTEMFELTNPFAIEHVSLADAADLVVVAPATANVLAKMANGIADDLLTCILLATRAPILVAPAMHTAMWEHPATRENVERLKARGVEFVGPAVGRLASGGTGIGRFAPVEEILDEALRLLGRHGDLAGRRVVVTAGGTHEPVDPIRFLGNRSSGKMGYAIAEAARDRGADVTLISGPTALRVPGGVDFLPVETAAEMLDAVRGAVSGADALVMAAAVADYTPNAPAASKLKKTDSNLVLNLKRTVDVLASIGDVSVKVGFAAETENLIENARAKLRQKGLDLVVANLVGKDNAPFGSDENEVTLVDADEAEELPRAPKRAIAERILDRVATLLARA